MAVTFGEKWYYWLVPMNSTGIPGFKSVSKNVETAAPPEGIPVDPPPKPIFTLACSDLDGNVAELAGLTFDDLTLASVKAITTATFILYLIREPPTTTTSADLSSGAGTLSLTDSSGVPDGSFLLLFDSRLSVLTPGEIVQYTAGAITRAEAGSVASAFASGSDVYLIEKFLVLASFSEDFFNTPDAGAWKFDVPLPGVTVTSVSGHASNSGGDGEDQFECQLSTTDPKGLFLTDFVPGSVLNVLNADASLTKAQRIINVTATTRDCNITLYNEEEMVSLSVLVKRIIGSTHLVNVLPKIGIPGDPDDDIDGNSIDVLGEEGEEKLYVAI